MDLAPDIRPAEQHGPTRNKTQMELAYDSLKVEAKTFWKEKTISGLAWCTFWMMNISNVLTIIYHCAPGWGWTLEVLGQEVIEGDVNGWYGLWYTCWQLVEPAGSRYPRSCSIVTDLTHVPEWWGGCQSMAVCALAFGIAAFIFLCLYMFKTNMNRRLRMLFPFVICEIASGVFGLILFILFCTLFLRTAFWCCSPDVVREIIEWKLWYCFYLCGIGTTLSIAAGIAGVFEIFEVLREKRKMLAYTGWMENEDTMTEYGNQLPIDLYAFYNNNYR